MDIAQLIRDEVHEQGLSQYRLSKDTGISQATLSRFLMGGGDLYLSTASQLFDYLGMEVLRPKKKPKRD